ncbi:MAG: hypothetical protein ACI8SJ_001675 [Shewanella sp.]|jgi:hypothetical protein
MILDEGNKTMGVYMGDISTKTGFPLLESPFQYNSLRITS